MTLRAELRWSAPHLPGGAHHTAAEFPDTPNGQRELRALLTHLFARAWFARTWNQSLPVHQDDPPGSVQWSYEPIPHSEATPSMRRALQGYAPNFPSTPPEAAISTVTMRILISVSLGMDDLPALSAQAEELFPFRPLPGTDHHVGCALTGYVLSRNGQPAALQACAEGPAWPPHWSAPHPVPGLRAVL